MSDTEMEAVMKEYDAENGEWVLMFGYFVLLCCDWVA